MNTKPVYLDLHIHTKENPNCQNATYDLTSLLKNIKDNALNYDFLISLTDHNTINKDAYIKLESLGVNYLVGVELSVRNYKECPFYHCHIYFDLKNRELCSTIDYLNAVLDNLYPNKLPSDDDSVPFIQQILDSFDDYEYLVLPHGGQSHRTFDKSIPSDSVRFDTVMQRATYYNVFDGFTARNNKGLEKTITYFKKLGINGFINLITCSDNYEPNCYPKGKDDQPFIKTWMYSEPTFSGLRISLTENNRLEYGDKPTESYQECIQKALLINENINLAVDFTPGLNVVIGNSSSGKTLLVDSLYSALSRTINNTYSKFGINNLKVDNPSNIIPHYFPQNFILENILKIASDEGKVDLSNVSILNSIFKLDDSEQRNISINLSNLESNLEDLLSSAESINQIMDEITKIPNVAKCVVIGDKISNPLNVFLPSSNLIADIEYSKISLDNDISILDNLLSRIRKIPIAEDISSDVNNIKQKLGITHAKSLLEKSARFYLKSSIKEISDSNSTLSEKDRVAQTFGTSLLNSLSNIYSQYVRFYDALNRLSHFNFSIKSKEIDSSGHKLYIENNLSITKDDLLNTFNGFLKSDFRFKKFEDISPWGFKTANFSQRPSIKTMAEYKNHVLSSFKDLNKTKYRILYNGKDDFDTLSPGIQSSIILDIILGYDKDSAPLIIDQPEDNLSTEYINDGLINKIKDNKNKKQIIIVTHNATIPMLGDAQNIILCSNKQGKINISSHRLEDEHEGRPITDWIATLTDGGKPSIKKRFKKYHIKDYREEE